MTSYNEMFTEAAHDWDLPRLYQALAKAKQEVSHRARKGLTEREKLFLRGLLCGYSPAEIAGKLHQSRKGVEVYVSKTLYQYFKKMADVPNDKNVGNWRNINNWLDDAGYKNNSGFSGSLNKYLKTESLAKIVNIGVFQDQKDSVTIDIDINIRVSILSQLDGAQAPTTKDRKEI